jgi:hypothetical protein
VAVFRTVATAHVSANQAFAQMHPFISHLQAFFASVGRRNDLVNRREVGARFYLHGTSTNLTWLSGVSFLLKLAGVCLPGSR